MSVHVTEVVSVLVPSYPAVHSPSSAQAIHAAFALISSPSLQAIVHTAHHFVGVALKIQKLLPSFSSGSTFPMIVLRFQIVVNLC